MNPYHIFMAFLCKSKIFGGDLMKKFFLIMVFAAFIGLMAAIPAAALESTFSGNWYTKGYIQKNFTGEDQSKALDLSSVYSFTRISYTAKINDNLSLKNTFGVEATWGDPDSAARIGTDGTKDFYIHTSYADFNLGPTNFTVGLQETTIARGFLFNKSFAGAIVSYKNEEMIIPFIWIKGYEGGRGNDADEKDMDYYALNPCFKLDENTTANFYGVWGASHKAAAWKTTDGEYLLGQPYNNYRTWYIGVDLDVKLEPTSFWFTGIYQGGKADDQDISAWLIGGGGAFNMKLGNIHTQVFYASGQKKDDDKITAFKGIPIGQLYYWGSIMGYGDSFDDYDWSANSCGKFISNILAANIGTKIKPTEKLEVTLDLWYGRLAEKNEAGDDVLGTEVDFWASYALIKGLHLKGTAAYMFAGDATYKGPNDANPYKLGIGLEILF
jgi:hypothetical protein